MATIPSEIILLEILPRTAARSLVRFKCVCKSFETQISCPKFINKHLNDCLSYNTNRLLIVNIGVDSLCCLDLDSPELPKFNIPLPKFNIPRLYSPKDEYKVDMVGSCNGLICIRAFYPKSHNYRQLFRFMVINPCTGFYLFPGLDPTHHAIDFSTFGFGYDSLNQDYKIVAIFNNYEEGGIVNDDFGILVFSLKGNSWRLIEKDGEFLSQNSLDGPESGGVVINNNLLHWMFYLNETDEPKIGCFDLKTEQWMKDGVALPDYDYNPVAAEFVDHFSNKLFQNRDKTDDVLKLGVLDGCLCVSTQIPERSGVQVWVMKEYGVKESWVKLLTVSDSDSIYGVPLATHRIKKDEILVIRSENKRRKVVPLKFVWYNINTKTYQIHDFPGVDKLNHAFICHGSLVVLPAGELIAKGGATTLLGS